MTQMTRMTRMTKGQKVSLRIIGMTRDDWDDEE